jgi:negative regulator of replication initiation
MRTTIAIDDDVLLAAKFEAARRKVSLGEAASDLIRAGLKASATRQTKPAATVGAFAILPPRDEIVTPEHVRRLMEQEGI